MVLLFIIIPSLSHALLYIFSGFYKDVPVHPFIVSFAGDVELEERTVTIIYSNINGLIPMYLMGEIGQVLESIDLDMKYMEDESRNMTDVSDGGRHTRRDLLSKATVLIALSGTLELEGDSLGSLDGWDSDRLTPIVKGFFTGGNRNKLLATLKSTGLAVDEIAVHEGTADSIVANEGTTSSSGDGTVSNGGDSDGGKSRNMTAVIVATVCGGFIVIVAAAIYVRGRRKQKSRNRYKNEMQSFADSYSLNLRSGQDDLPDSNASVSASQVSFPDVFVGVGSDGRQNLLLPTLQGPGDDEHDEYDDMLDDILDDEWDNDSSKAIKITKKKKSRGRGKEHGEDVEKAATWARKVRKKHVVPLSARQQLYGSNSGNCSDDEI